MNSTIELPTSRSDFLTKRLFGLMRNVKGIDPRLVRVFIPWVARHPRYLPGFVRLARAHAQSHRTRSRAVDRGEQVPPFLVLSVTSKCNLRCTGCFAGAIGTVASAPRNPGLALDDWRRVVDEAASLGVLAFVIAGGEPFMLPGIAKLFEEHPDRLFVVFTNGTTMQPSDFEILKRCSNVAVVVSLEGDRDLTDNRRGSGVFEKALASLDRLSDAGVLTGISVTIGPRNVAYWSQPANIDALLAHSGPLAFFIEQIPIGENEGLLTEEQRSGMRETVAQYRKRASGSAYIIHSPDDEEELGGCVSAGRGFVHINPSGDVTACPMSALATHNVQSSSLRQALASPLFTMIRENANLLETEGHPCGLSAHAADLETLTKGLGAYATSVPESVAARKESIVTIH